jgi:sarcosine oxidase/L-pipecolate oxidase
VKTQYGFISGRSTSLQLLEVLDKWTEALDNGHCVDCIYMDFQKAFDKVPHKKLLEKIKSYGIPVVDLICEILLVSP